MFDYNKKMEKGEKSVKGGRDDGYSRFRSSFPIFLFVWIERKKIGIQFLKMK